jgi:hypothetical protein
MPDRRIQPVFGREEGFRRRHIFAAHLVNGPDVAARAKSAPRCCVNQNRVNGLILCPFVQAPVHFGAHFVGQRIQRLWPVKGKPAYPAFTPDQNIRWQGCDLRVLTPNVYCVRRLPGEPEWRKQHNILPCACDAYGGTSGHAV